MHCPVFRRATFPAVLTALALTASAACSRGTADKGAAGAGPTATVATEPAPTTTTNPYAVPAVIDVAYVNRVLAGLDAVEGDVTRLVVASKSIPPDALDRLRAVFGTPDMVQFKIDGFQLELSTGLRNYRPQIGNRSSIATQLLVARRDCIFAQVTRDLSAVGIDTKAVVNPQWIAMKPLNPASDPKHYNPTPWALVYDGFTENRSQPPNPCAS